MLVRRASHGSFGTGDSIAATAAPGSVRGTLRSAVATSVVGKAVELGTLVLLATVVPRALGPADYGRFAVALTIVTIASLALTLGGPTLVTRFVPAARPEQRVALARALAARLARSRAAWVTGTGLVATAAVAIDTETFPPLTTALVVAALALNVATTVMLLSVLGLGRAGAWSARFPLQNAVLVAAVLALHPVAPAAGPVVAIVVSAAVAAAVALIAAWPVLTSRPTAEVRVPPGAVRFGALQGGGAALVQLTHRAGVLAVAVLAGSAAETGYAALATGLALGATYAVLQVFTVSLPHLADQDVGAGGGDALAPVGHAGEPVLRRLTGLMTGILVPVLAVGALALPRLVPVVFGGEFDGATGAFVPAVALVALAPLSAMLVQVAALRLRPEVALGSAMIGALVFLAVATVAVPTWGASGGTAAPLAGITATAAVAAARLRGAVTPALAAGAFGGTALVALLGLTTHLGAPW